MEFKNLGWKFAFCALLAAMCIYTIGVKELRQGIDLKGGHVLTFEVRTAQRERENLENQIQDLKKEEAATASQPAAKADLDKRIAELKNRQDDLSRSGSSIDIVQRVVARLKKRIDPSGMLALEWRPIGQNRFEVRMPLGTEESNTAKKVYLTALDDLQASNITRSELQQVVSLAETATAPAGAMDELINRIAHGNATRVAALKELVTANQAMHNAERALKKSATDANKAAYADAAADYDTALRKVMATNVLTERIGQIATLYVSEKDRNTIPLAEREEREKAYVTQTADLFATHADRKVEIEKILNAYKDWTNKRVGLDDPADLKRLVAKAGVLEFRIAPVLPTSNEEPKLTQAQFDSYSNQLAEQGPMASRNRNEPYQWFEIKNAAEAQKMERMVTGKYGGKNYILLANTRGDTILQDDPKRPWSLTATSSRDDMGRPAVSFTLDARGANYMGDLTERHVKHHMAILLDDQVYSAPSIHTTIHDRGQITGEFKPEEVTELVNTLEAGALEGKVNGTPVSEKTIAPSIGEDNRNAAIKAAYWAILATALFMFFYYFLAGAVADTAMMFNLILTLGAMSFVEAVFTLPGIAGLILATAMVVDANVLIYERLREEQRKNQSMRLAFKNAYQNAFSAIFDSNITTLIAAVIMAWVGTEEVRGFGITLGLGVLFNLFTAILFSRWVFEFMLSRHIIKAPLRMMRLIGQPNIDWMGKRWYFWAISIVTSILGLVALFSQGKEILGIEFSSGTEVTFQFRMGGTIDNGKGNTVYPQREAVEDSLVATADRMRQEARKQLQQLQSQTAATPAEQSEDRAVQIRKLGEQIADLTKFIETAKVETLLNTNKAGEFVRDFGSSSDAVTVAELKARNLPDDFIAYLDPKNAGKVARSELAGRLPERNYQLSTTVAKADVLREIVRNAFGTALNTPSSVTFELANTGGVPQLGNISLDPKNQGLAPITPELESKVPTLHRPKFTDFQGGVAFILNKVSPPQTESEIAARIQAMRLQPDFTEAQFVRTAVIPLNPDVQGKSDSFAVLNWNPDADTATNTAEWKAFAQRELNVLSAAMSRNESLESVNSFDPAVAGQTTQMAIIALALSWIAIIVYLWIRFGQARWGLAAVICLVHDVIISVGLVAISGWIAHHEWLGRALLVTKPIQVDMTVIAAFLTIVGYSVNDTIVVFDRIRENRGRLKDVDAKTINLSINQTLSRTLLTGVSTGLALLTMYIFGGDGIHAFTYAMLGGFIIGTYSSIAVASPILLGVRRLFATKEEKRPSLTPAGK